MRLMTAMILAMSISVTAFAKQNTLEGTVKLKKVADSKVQLIYGMVPSGAITVKIYDDFNTLLHTDRILSKKEFSKAYDFSKLAEGKYQIGVFNNSGEIDHLELNLGTDRKVEPVVFSKLEKVENNQYKLLVNSLLPSNMTVLIYENNQLVHEEELFNSKGFQKTYIFNHSRSNSKIEFFVKSDNGFSKLLATK
ncbi:hypothetical protein Belba_0550 [Belliella baltica DSM 15883]|uniref:DUF4397 domain-containing protein n=1 Tax=Belliella baltica (strain DSM 15883 / CIP 108006 / LMG 21964 / BA134) TaxID=866536 RepID=I3Z1T9_BELBD|nr:hypothetical protein [Belliella baltica]AFL83207.1 hypothetical protein Belba_0550 [Belliella baltica DSM 15883]